MLNFNHKKTLPDWEEFFVVSKGNIDYSSVSATT